MYFDIEAPTEARAGRLVARGRAGDEVARLRFELSGAGRGTFAVAGLGAELEGAAAIARAQDGTVSVDLTLDGQRTVLTTPTGASAPIAVSPEARRLLEVWVDLAQPLQTIARASFSDAGFAARFGDWDLTACGLTWLGVAVGVGVCATGQLAGCIPAFAGAAQFVEHC